MAPAAALRTESASAALPNVAPEGLPTIAPAALPPLPPASLDPILDAAAESFARFGVRRTTVPDVARAARRSRATVYRQSGGIGRITQLLLSRELHRLLAVLAHRLDGPPTAQTVTAAVAEAVRFARAHPVLKKILVDEPEAVGALVTRELPAISARVSQVIGPSLAGAVRDGGIVRRDPAVIADWLVRLGLSLVVADPPGELDDYLAQVVRPVLEPPSRKDRGPR